MKLASLTLALTVALAACRGDNAQCEQACRNVYTISFWHKAKARKAPNVDEATWHKEQEALLASELERGLSFCASQCVAANDRDRAKCMIAATTAEQAQACMPKPD